MCKGKLLYSLFGVFLSLLIVTAAHAQNDPVSMLQKIADNMISGLKENKATLKTKPTIVYNLAYKYIVPYADLATMSKRVLPPATWNNATSAQRAQFEKEFTTTLIRTYASALTAYRDQTVHFYPVRGGSSRSIVVNSQIESSENSPIQVTYRLIQANGSWKVYDMSVEGVSMLDSFRSQFSDILAQGNIDSLLKRMASHNRR